jgi:phosphopantothenoylcysteine decarboxylase/phosphopantothenate--cysteine ligase
MKRILLGITGSIAAYKTPDLVRKLLDADFDVKVVLTESAKSFVSPLVLQTLASPENVFEAFLEPTMQHIQLAKWADIILIVPATANILAKLAHGFSDDLLSSTCLVSDKKIILAPGMNQSMWLNTATAHNVETLKSRNIEFWGPDEGIQACGDMGPGRMLEPNEIIQRLLIQPNTKPLLSGKKILITAGPTQEPIDPVRFISNRSSGKMGYALAKEAMLMGADVTLISGPVSLKNPGCKQFIPVKTARDMAEAVELNLEGKDVFIAAAAVADYEVESVSSQKIKKTGQSLELLLKPTKDILLSLVAQSNKPYLIGFAAETENLIENAQGKLQRKNLDMMIANDVSRQDIGFDSSDNEVFILTNNSSELTQIKKSAKHEVARKILLKLAKELS